MRHQLLNSQIPDNLSAVKNILLTNRQIKSDDQFFHPIHPNDLTLSQVGINMREMKKALGRIDQAIKNQEQVVIIGDYDADGVCASAILWQALNQAGAKVLPFIPDRFKHGYGLSLRSIEDVLALKPKLVITVDNGIVAHQAAQALAEAKVDLIITDHHQVEKELPPALAHIHTTKLCGATVAWMLSRELSPTSAQQSLDLCAIATIADQVLLLAANRSFALFGLEALRQTKRVGLLALFHSAQIEPAQISEHLVNFVIAPRINAMGRLKHSLESLRLLCTTNQKRAESLAALLSDTNLERQNLTQDLLLEAKLSVETKEQEHLIIAASEKFHDGVIGLIAGKLTEEFYKPAIVMSINKSLVKASARSVSGVNIVELIRLVKNDLLEVGGHPMAAGFSLEISRLSEVSLKLKTLAKAQIDPQLLEPAIRVECQLPLKLVDQPLVDLISEFAPFGPANPQPIFSFSAVKVLDAWAMGAEKKHLKLVLENQDQGLAAVFWQQGKLAEKLSSGTQINLAGSVEANEWRGKTTIQIKVKDLNFSPNEMV